MTKPYPNQFETGLKWFSTHARSWRRASVPQSRAARGQGVPPPSLVQRRDRTPSKTANGHQPRLELSPARARFTISSWKATFQPENITLAENREKPRTSIFPQLVFHVFDQAGWPGSSLPPGSRSPLTSSFVFATRKQKRGKGTHTGKIPCSELSEVSL